MLSLAIDNYSNSGIIHDGEFSMCYSHNASVINDHSEYQSAFQELVKDLEQ